MPPKAKRSGRATNDKGTVTVEMAVALTAFAVVLSLSLATISAAIDQLRCTDAAREAARLTARGDEATALHAAQRIAPEGAAIEVTTAGEEIHVSVHSTPLAGLLPGLLLSADAYAIAEPALEGATP